MDDETLATTSYTLVDDWYKQEGAEMVRSRPGPKPRCTDSEILTLALLHLFPHAWPVRKGVSPLGPH
ncbi:MAG: hypothetical protein ACP5R2_09160, partial [Anaerolineae bacterium]